MKTVFTFLLLPLLLLAEGCSYSVHQYAMGDYYPSTPGSSSKTARAIKSEDEQFVVLWFQFNTDYIDRAREKLISQCTNGEVVGVNIRHSTSLGFLSYTNKAVVRATCVE